MNQQHKTAQKHHAPLRATGGIAVRTRLNVGACQCNSYTCDDDNSRQRCDGCFNVCNSFFGLTSPKSMACKTACHTSGDCV